MKLRQEVGNVRIFIVLRTEGKLERKGISASGFSVPFFESGGQPISFLWQNCLSEATGAIAYLCDLSCSGAHSS